MKETMERQKEFLNFDGKIAKMNRKFILDEFSYIDPKYQNTVNFLYLMK